MKQKVFKTTTSLLLTAGMAFSTLIPFASASSADTDSGFLSQFNTISREYDTTNDGLLRYHYVDENGETVDVNHLLMI